MIRKLPKKSDNHGIPYPIIEEVECNLPGFTEYMVFDSNGNYMHDLLCDENPERIDERFR